MSSPTSALLAQGSMGSMGSLFYAVQTSFGTVTKEGGKRQPVWAGKSADSPCSVPWLQTYRGDFTWIKPVRRFTSLELPSWILLTGKGLGVIKQPSCCSCSMKASSTHWPKQKPFKCTCFSMDSIAPVVRAFCFFCSYLYSLKSVNFISFTCSHTHPCCDQP